MNDTDDTRDDKTTAKRVRALVEQCEEHSDKQKDCRSTTCWRNTRPT